MLNIILATSAHIRVSAKDTGLVVTMANARLDVGTIWLAVKVCSVTYVSKQITKVRPVDPLHLFSLGR
jgi:hypothetical protein